MIISPYGNFNRGYLKAAFYIFLKRVRLYNQYSIIVILHEHPIRRKLGKNILRFLHNPTEPYTESEFKDRKLDDWGRNYLVALVLHEMDERTLSGKKYLDNDDDSEESDSSQNNEDINENIQVKLIR